MPISQNIKYRQNQHTHTHKQTYTHLHTYTHKLICFGFISLYFSLVALRKEVGETNCFIYRKYNINIKYNKHIHRKN